MGELVLVLLLCCAAAGSIPLLAGAHMRGSLQIPRWLLATMTFCGVAIIAILRFPLTPSNGSLRGYFSALIVYVFAGRFLRKAYAIHKWRFCMLLVFLANCFGLLIKCFIIEFAIMNFKHNFTFMSMVIFSVIVQAVVFSAYFTASEAEVKKTTQTKKKKK